MSDHFILKDMISERSKPTLMKKIIIVLHVYALDV